MPTYQYECEACGHGFEAFQSMTEERLSQCPKCGKKKLARLIGSGAGIIFKGNGFYATDYKKKTPAAESPKEKKDASGPKPCSGSCACHPQ